MGCLPCFGSAGEGASKKGDARKEASSDLRVARDGSDKSKPQGGSDSKKDAVILREGNNQHIAAHTFTFRELAAATKNFRQDCLLGEGGFGRVYKGRLESGQAVAVKQLDRNGLQGNREFLVEVLMLSLLHHDNLVNLIGYCADGDQRLLVYEFMPLRSLEDHLHDIPPDKEPLDWNTRMKIAAGAAKGLEYLHDKASPPVIYRDFKSSNILLGEGYHPKLSDFGLAKLGPVGDKTHVSTRVMGTYGYCAPEYAMTGQLTVKSDVYSFGVVFLELITGRKAIDNTKPHGEQNLVAWARPLFKDRRKFPKMADPLLQGRFPMRGLYQALAVAAMCLQEQAATRPFVGDVVTALSYLASQTYDSNVPAQHSRSNSSTPRASRGGGSSDQRRRRLRSPNHNSPDLRRREATTTSKYEAEVSRTNSGSGSGRRSGLDDVEGLQVGSPAHAGRKRESPRTTDRQRAVAGGIHAYAIKHGLTVDQFVLSSLIHMYASCGDTSASRLLFDAVEDRSVVIWNSIIAGYFRNRDWKDVVDMFKDMVEVGALFDQITLVSVATACGRVGDVKLGEWIGRYAEENGMMGNRNLVTTLVDMYAKCGELAKARVLFDRMKSRDVVAWSAMISGYTQADKCHEALALFSRMQATEVEPNDVTLVSVLSACAVLVALETGKWVHSYIRKNHLPLTVVLGTALVDFYAKCGCIDSAVEVFELMPVKNPWTWTALIKGMASNGKGREALKLFSSMCEAKCEPTDVTFIGVLLACSHSGLVEEARWHFNSMSQDYGIQPKVEHYGCIVDLLGRAGLIDEAYQFIRTMPIEPNTVVWRTLLSSCAVYKNVEIGEEALKRIIVLDPSHSGDYILLSNIYASVGRWKDAAMIRMEMKDRGIERSPGCSLIELDGTIFEFFAEDSDHPQLREIYEKVEEMIGNIKMAGYVPNTADARLDIDECEKEVSVSHHSEKLAIAFGLMKLQPGTTIRLSKNLRVCTDCHLATKLISRVYNREIVVRDRNRFHHFKDGYCSCNDYW